MQVLQYPLLELKDRIDQELQENVFLEVPENELPNTEARGSETEGDVLPRPKEEDPGLATAFEKLDNDPTSSDPGLAQSYETLDQLEARSQDFSPRRSFRGDDDDNKFEALNNAPGPSESLSEHLIRQIVLTDLPDDERDRVEIVIYSLDRDGRLVATVEELMDETQCTREDIENAVRLVQSLEPSGVGARDLTECLLLQLTTIEGVPALVERIIENHLENLSMNRIPRISKETGASINEVKEAVDFLRKHLHPHPGAPYGDVRNQTIKPDIVVMEVDGRFEIRVEKGGIPNIRISSVYRQLLQGSKEDPKVQEYLRKKIESAKWFIDAIMQRQNTIQKIATTIVDTQAEFLRKGIRFLKPLRMQDIADEVGVHISTVSRAISGKYIQTPQGIFDMKRFFSAGTRSDSGEMVSQQAVKQKLKAIVAKEDRKKPLSDDAIVLKLESDGIRIARRTVTKYRKSLGIPSSNQRKAY